jgi:hypothetical protein
VLRASPACSSSAEQPEGVRFPGKSPTLLPAICVPIAWTRARLEAGREETRALSVQARSPVPLIPVVACPPSSVATDHPGDV